ncbi:MAG TPA: Clp protease N-terminal domain-containing protein [Thermomicrobiales bacterium]|jgi:ATP-dependent Clp protease ATP-binding subunit ClpA
MADKLDQFTTRAKYVLMHAEEEARSFGHPYIGTEHLLLGVVREGEGIGARALLALEIDEPRLRDAVTYVVDRGEKPVSGKLELVPRAKHALELAVEEARRMRHHHIGTEHILLGLLLEEEGVAAGILAGLGVDYATARQQITALLGTTGQQGVRAVVERAVRGRRERGRGNETPETRNNVITVRVSDRDLAAIDALVESGIRTTRSDAASWLIGVGVTANRQLLERIYATIEQIRQLRADAQSLAQEVGTDADETRG